MSDIITNEEITEADFINLANGLVGTGLLYSGNKNFELAKKLAKQKSIEFAEWVAGFETLGQCRRFHEVKTNDDLFPIYLQHKSSNPPKPLRRDQQQSEWNLKDYLNQLPPKPEDVGREVDWKIVSMKTEHGAIYTVPFQNDIKTITINEITKEMIVGGNEIFAVRRVSDNVTFSVGDKVEVANITYVIESFKINSQNIMQVHTGAKYPLWFDSMHKVPPERSKDDFENIDRPPLGLLPTKFWKTARLNEIESAIIRYVNARREIPKEWITERDELLAWVKSLNLKYEFPKIKL